MPPIATISTAAIKAGAQLGEEADGGSRGSRFGDGIGCLILHCNIHLVSRLLQRNINRHAFPAAEVCAEPLAFALAMRTRDRSDFGRRHRFHATMSGNGPGSVRALP